MISVRGKIYWLKGERKQIIVSSNSAVNFEETDGLCLFAGKATRLW